MESTKVCCSPRVRGHRCQGVKRWREEGGGGRGGRVNFWIDQATVRRAGCKYLKSLSRAGGNGFRSRNVCWEKRGRAMRVLCCEMGELFLFLPPPALVRGGLQVPASRFPALRSLPPRPTIVFENANR